MDDFIKKTLQRLSPHKTAILSRAVFGLKYPNVRHFNTRIGFNNNSPSAHLTYTRIYYLALVAKTTSLKFHWYSIWDLEMYVNMCDSSFIAHRRLRSHVGMECGSSFKEKYQESKKKFFHPGCWRSLRLRSTQNGVLRVTRRP